MILLENSMLFLYTKESQYINSYKIQVKIIPHVMAACPYIVIKGTKNKHKMSKCIRDDPPRKEGDPPGQKQ